jgi:hypothetical protein
MKFGDFKEALKNIVNEDAPRPSMAIANMVKGWPTEVRQFLYARVHFVANVRDPLMDEGQTAKTCVSSFMKLECSMVRKVGTG